MLKRLAIIVLLLVPSAAFAAWAQFMAASNILQQGWHQINIGGGGFATGIDMHADGTKLSRTNTGGAYKWNGSQWVQIIDDTLPAAIWANNQSVGVMEIVAAPSATSTCYMHYFGYLLKSITGCTSGTWSNLSAWIKDSDLSNAGSAQFGAVGPLIAVDPADATANHFVAGSNNTISSGGLYYSINGSAVTQVPPSQVEQSPSYLLVAYDPSTTSGGSTPGIYAADAGGYTTSISQSVTFTNGSAAISSTNSFFSGEPVTFFTSNSLPTNFSTNTTYYVSATGLSSSSFQVSATPGGSVILAGSAGSGSQSVMPVVGFTNGSANIAAANNFGAGQPIKFSVGSGSLPTGLTAGTTYWVLATGLSANGFQVSATTGGAAIVMGSAATGYQTFSTVPEVYHTTTGPSGTWTRVITSSSGGPTACISITVDINGNLWCADLTVWKYNGTAWSHVITTQDQGGYFSVAIDPTTTGASTEHVFANAQYGNLNVSLDTGSTWSGLVANISSPTVSATDVPWLGTTQQISMTIGRIMFDPAATSNLYAAAGTGIFYITNPPTSNVTTTNLVWTSQTAAQETLVANQVLNSGSYTNAFVWDRSAFQITNLFSGYKNSQTAYPAVSPVGVWAADWCTGSSSTFVMIDSQSFSTDVNDHSSVSSDGGKTWTLWGAKPTLIGNGAWHGGIACGGASDFMYIQGDTSSLPSYTGNGAATSWASITGTSLPTDGWTTNGVSNRRVVADRVTANTFYIANNGATSPGIYTCTGGSCSRTTTTLPDSGEPNLVSVPGQAGHIFGNFFQHSVQFSTNGGLTWNSITQFAGSTVLAVGFGATFSGSSYPSVYIVGTNSGGTFGVWQCKNFNSSTGACTSIWANLGYPLNSFNEIQWVDGDKNTPGLIYLATNGNGAIYGYFP